MAMTAMTTLALLLLLQQRGAVSPEVPPAPAFIDGIVIDSQTGRPLAGATVLLQIGGARNGTIEAGVGPTLSYAADWTCAGNPVCAAAGAARTIQVPTSSLRFEYRLLIFITDAKLQRFSVNPA